MLLQTIRDLREFLAAKKRKREPLRFAAKGVAESTYVPQHIQGFANFRAALRLSDFGQASVELDRLVDALRRRHGVELPLPRKLIQNADRSITVFWEGLTIRAFTDGVVTLTGGKNPTRGVTTELLDMLAFQARVKRCQYLILIAAAIHSFTVSRLATDGLAQTLRAA